MTRVIIMNRVMGYYVCRSGRRQRFSLLSEADDPHEAFEEVRLQLVERFGAKAVSAIVVPAVQVGDVVVWDRSRDPVYPADGVLN